MKQTNSLPSCDFCNDTGFVVSGVGFIGMEAGKECKLEVTFGGCPLSCPERMDLLKEWFDSDPVS